MQAHLCAYIAQSASQEVCVTHPVLERSEDVFNGSPSHRHRIRHPVQSLLGSFQYRLMFPSRDSSIIARGALGFNGATRTGTASVAMQLHAMLLAGEAIDRTLSSRTQVFVIPRNVDEVCSVEAAMGSCA